MASILDIPELVGEVMSHISDSKTFYSALQVNKTWRDQGRDLVPRKKREFIKIRSYVDSNDFLHKIPIYPNGTKHGEEEVVDEETKEVVGTRPWVEGVLDGIECEYYDGDLIKEIPWVKGKKEGEEIKYRPTGAKVKTQWKDNRRVKRTHLDSTGSVVREDIYSGVHTCVRFLLNNHGKLEREGVYINGERHGFFTVSGKQVLFLHGVIQDWYSENWWAIALYMFIILAILGIVVYCYTNSSIWPIFSLWYFILTVGVFFLPLFMALYRGGSIFLTFSNS